VLLFYLIKKIKIKLKIKPLTNESCCLSIMSQTHVNIFIIIIRYDCYCGNRIKNVKKKTVINNNALAREIETPSNP